VRSEQRLTELQRRVASLEAAVKPRPRDAWKQIIGISKGQPLDREAARLGAEWRAKENKRRESKAPAPALRHNGLENRRHLPRPQRTVTKEQSILLRQSSELERGKPA